MPTTLGAVETVNLDIHPGGDLTFAFIWVDVDGDEVPLDHIEAPLGDEDDPLLDLGDYVTMDGNRANVLVPADVIDNIPLPSARPFTHDWKFIAVSDVGERMVVCSGKVRVL